MSSKEEVYIGTDSESSDVIPGTDDESESLTQAEADVVEESSDAAEEGDKQSTSNVCMEDSPLFVPRYRRIKTNVLDSDSDEADADQENNNSSQEFSSHRAVLSSSSNESDEQVEGSSNDTSYTQHDETEDGSSNRRVKKWLDAASPSHHHSVSADIEGVGANQEDLTANPEDLNINQSSVCEAEERNGFFSPIAKKKPDKALEYLERSLSSMILTAKDTPRSKSHHLDETSEEVADGSAHFTADTVSLNTVEIEQSPSLVKTPDKALEHVERSLSSMVLAAEGVSPHLNETSEQVTDVRADTVALKAAETVQSPSPVNNETYPNNVLDASCIPDTSVDEDGAAEPSSVLVAHFSDKAKEDSQKTSLAKDSVSTPKGKRLFTPRGTRLVHNDSNESLDIVDASKISVSGSSSFYSPRGKPKYGTSENDSVTEINKFAAPLPVTHNNHEDSRKPDSIKKSLFTPSKSRLTEGPLTSTPSRKTPSKKLFSSTPARIDSTDDGKKAMDFTEDSKADDSVEVLLDTNQEATVTDAKPFKPQKSRQELERELKQKQELYRKDFVRKLPDGGLKIKNQIKELEEQLKKLETTGQQGNKIQQKPVLKENFGSSQWSAAALKPLQHSHEPAFLKQVNGPTFQDLAQMSSSSSSAAVDPRMSQEMMRKMMKQMYTSNPDYDRLYGGRMDHVRQMEVRTVTSDAVTRLHESIKSIPPEAQETQQPSDMLVDLMPHQKQALTWLLWRETQMPPGGILADDMGLGKTLSMVSLILKQRELKEENDQDEDYLPRDAENAVKSDGTLIVCPASLIGQWEGEINRRLIVGTLRVLLYHGNNREKNPRRLARYDVVITTYQVLMREIVPSKGKKGEAATQNITKNSPILSVAWNRIVLDEAHTIRNHKSQTAIAMFHLRGLRRWALTGTPIQNRELDMYALLRFLRCKPFDEYEVWKRWVDNKSAAGARRLNLLVKAVVLRRTKQQLDVVTKQPIVELPERKEEVHMVSLSQEELKIYNKIFNFSRSAVAAFCQKSEEREQEKMNMWTYGGNPSKSKTSSSFPSALGSGLVGAGAVEDVKSHHILVLLLRLRQICCHPVLIKSMLEPETKEREGIVDNDDTDLDMLAGFKRLSLHPSQEKEEEEVKEEDLLSFNNPIFKEEQVSSKLEHLIGHLQGITERGEKCVIVSQWTSMLSIVERHLRESGRRCHAINGSVHVKERTVIVDDFNLNRSGPKVLLLSLAAGGVGLNLVGGNHLFILDLHWNPQMENQACDRIYRMGQTRPVFIHKYICKNTIEERIAELQQKKLAIAQDVLTGAKKKFSNKLTLEDLKTLFSLK